MLAIPACRGAEAGEPRVLIWPGLHKEILSQKKRKELPNFSKFSETTNQQNLETEHNLSTRNMKKVVQYIIINWLQVVEKRDNISCWEKMQATKL
jgi:hypothetical protein